MRWALSLIVTILLVGCGKETPQRQPEARTKPKGETKKPELPVDKTKAAAKKSDPPKAFTNTLGMKFVPVRGTEVAFCIWETRVKDYMAYVSANAGVATSWKTPFGDKFKQEETHPVVNVSWNDAQAFCAWLTKKELAAGKIKQGQKYRLPTDAEWSVAVGLGKEAGNTPMEKDSGWEITSPDIIDTRKNTYPFGKWADWPFPKGVGNYDNEYLKLDIFEYTSPVGSFAVNQYGIHDLGGNVWEWCEDWYNPATKEYRVFRGASWGDFVDYYMLSSFRKRYLPDFRSSEIGFRCVLASE